MRGKRRDHTRRRDEVTPGGRRLRPRVGFAVEAAEALPRPTISEAIRIQRLYRPPAGARDRPGPEPERPRRDVNELIDLIGARLAEIEQEQAQAKIDSGWVQDETGYWIPPGWVRAAA